MILKPRLGISDCSIRRGIYFGLDTKDGTALLQLPDRACRSSVGQADHAAARIFADI
jgi:hypothetical protein